MRIWGLIIFASATALFFRALPFLVKNNNLLTNQSGKFYKFLTYSTQAMLGIIIYDTAFHTQNALEFIHSFSILTIIKLCLLGLVFFLVIKTKRMLAPFFLGLIIYFLVLWTITNHPLA